MAQELHEDCIVEIPQQEIVMIKKIKAIKFQVQSAIRAVQSGNSDALRSKLQNIKSMADKMIGEVTNE